jgi:hypothetical protein
MHYVYLSYHAHLGCYWSVPNDASVQVAILLPNSDSELEDENLNEKTGVVTCLRASIV